MIVLRAKEVDFKVTYIDLRNKPDWFLAISPHGKVPVLSVDDLPLFESNAIAEYLDETVAPKLHPDDPIKRARNRAWNDFVPDFAGGLGRVTYAKTREDMEAAMELAGKRVDRLETAIRDERGNDGPYFNGPSLCLVDASYAPFLTRFHLVGKVIGSGLLGDFPLVEAWTKALVESPAVRDSVAPEFEEVFISGLENRGCYAGELMAANA